MEARGQRERLSRTGITSWLRRASVIRRIPLLPWRAAAAARHRRPRASDHAADAAADGGALVRRAFGILLRALTLRGGRSQLPPPFAFWESVTVGRMRRSWPMRGKSTPPMAKGLKPRDVLGAAAAPLTGDGDARAAQRPGMNLVDAPELAETQLDRELSPDCADPSPWSKS